MPRQVAVDLKPVPNPIGSAPELADTEEMRVQNLRHTVHVRTQSGIRSSASLDSNN
jgi:hypothetical protein